MPAANRKCTRVVAASASKPRVIFSSRNQRGVKTTARSRPELFAGVVPMSGRLIPAAWENRVSDDALQRLSFMVVHGTQDTVLPITQGRQIRDTLSQLPVALTYKEYPMAHQVSEESLTDITNWLTEHLNG